MLNRLIPAAAVAAISASAFAQSLTLGDAMPTIGDDANWLKGSPVSAWEQGEIYVLDFWATWCGPCIASIPHVNELSQKHAADGVNVIGMAIWPRQGMTPTDQYVEEKGDEMSYRIAEDVDGKLAERYMSATGSNGIPTIMIVNREGKLVWKGHPMSGFDEALESVIDGTFDLDEAKKQAAIEREAETFIKEANAKAGAGDWSGVVAQLKQAVELEGYSYGPYYGMVAFTVMATPERGNDLDGAYAYARTLVKRFGDNEEIFANMAQFIAEGPIADDKRDLEFAKELAKRALKNAKDESPLGHAAMGAVHHAEGDYDAAIAAQEKAIAIATEQGDARVLKQLEATLDEYKSHKTN